MNALPETELTSTERLRARVAARADTRHGLEADGPRRLQRSVLPWVLVAVLASFLLGLIANPWFEAEVRSRLPAFARGTTAATTPQVAALAGRVAALEARPAMAEVTLESADGERLARLEGRIAALDSAAAANTRRLDALAGGVATATARVEAATDESEDLIAAARASAGQARGVVLITAARRAIEAGRPLGALGGALTGHFGAGPAVTAINALGSAPTTPALLSRDLARLAPALRGDVRPARGDWLDIFAGTVMSAFRPSPSAGAILDATTLIAAAQSDLARGDVGGAVARIGPLPASGQVSGWRASATRWIAAQRGLDALEAGLMNAAATPAAVL